MEEVVLVNIDDRVLGQMEKIQAHKEGVLHRAISICLFDEKNRWLVQRRAFRKYHSPGKWSNSCCSHPRPDESTEMAASRRMFEELGVVCPLVFCTSFVYRADVGDGLIEHEFDHVFIGHYDGPFAFNPEEVEATEWWETERIREALKETPSIFTPWFSLIFERVVSILKLDCGI